MKTVFIIASIILISYQIDRFVTRDVALPVEHTGKTTLAGALAQDQLFTDTAEILRSVKEIKDQPATVLAVSAKKTSVVKQQSGKATKFSLRQSKKVNRFASSLHRSIKESGNYEAINSVMFDNNNFASIKTEEFNTILRYADYLIFDESLKVSIAGFTDNVGNADYNEQLSLMRAINIQRYLVELGVDEKRIVISANGMADPVADNDTVEGRSLNRRVEIALFHQTLATAAL
ncbi:MAG: OmpA family protein [Chitinophagaceae bacterium]|nr:OmpA family protein [Chitinophagaceae bacterium]